MAQINKKKKTKLITAPRTLKFKKWHKFHVRKLNYSKGGSQLLYGSYGLRILKSTRLFWKQIEAARQKISRRLKKKSKILIRVFPNLPVTQKPKEVRMGKGKGAVDHYVVRAEAGRVIFELANVDAILARALLEKASKKLPVPSVVIHRKLFKTDK